MGALSFGVLACLEEDVFWLLTSGTIFKALGMDDQTVSKRVCIIRAGISGLLAIKSCLDEDLIPVCFERSSQDGGLWYYNPEVVEGSSCVMKSTIASTRYSGAHTPYVGYG